MAFQGRSIKASVELDLKPLELSITKANEMLGKLGGAFKFDTTSIEKLEEYMGQVRDIFKMVSDEALKINEAFNNIQGLKTFIENLEILKAKMETIANDVDKINQAILRENKSATQFAETEQRINGIMDKDIPNPAFIPSIKGCILSSTSSLKRTSIRLAIKLLIPPIRG